MGKGQGKKGRREAKLDAKKANEESKIPGLPSLKKPEKVPSRDKKSAISTNPPEPAAYPIPIGSAKPFTKSPQHAKWPALFKKHLGLIEAHIRTLDRVMQSMKSEMEQMEEKEKIEWELGERGDWRVICEMMDRAREVLASAREAARGILPARSLQQKKGLGVIGTDFEPIGPQLKQKAEELGYDARGKGKLGRNLHEVDSDLDTIMSESNADSSDPSDSSSLEDEDKEGAEAGSTAEGDDFVPFTVGTQIPRLNGEIEEEAATNGDAEFNPYFVVDTEPTPINLTSTSNGTKTNIQIKETKKEKKLRLGAEREVKRGERKAVGEQRRQEREEREKAAAEAPETSEPEATKSATKEVDFTALEAKLQAEIAAGTKAKSESEMKKKRRRSSAGDDEVETKKVRKEVVKEVVAKTDKKRKAEGDEDEDENSEPAEKKKSKKEKKEKKRKAESEEPVDEGRKKKRKHRSEET